MTKARVTGLRGIELGVRNLGESASYYEDVWGLKRVARHGDSIYLRARGAEHHIVQLNERPKSALMSIKLAAPDKAAVDELHAAAVSFGADVTTTPAALPADGGGGYGFALNTPEGHKIMISSDVARHADIGADRTTPVKLTHAVLNTTRPDDQMRFFCDLLGFRLSDCNGRMNFVRCSKDHHAIALAEAEGPGLNHMAYEMDSFDSLMRGCGRLKANDVTLEWGVGRHGPGDNIFAYFVEPNGFVTEYTADVEQIEDDNAYVPHDEAYWNSFPMRPCRWGMATTPSKHLRHAMSGKLAEERNQLCDEIISKSLSR
ncbi:MAG: hypothetical protein RLZ98_686 [Pseudomonadota bacterium]|jgi:catechol 2,3-dioxygenase